MLSKIETKQVADTIVSQISVGTKMAIGYRLPLFGADDGIPYLQFTVTIKRGVRHVVKVYLENDLYNVVLFRLRGGGSTEENRRDGVYADRLSEVVYRLCHPL